MRRHELDWDDLDGCGDNHKHPGQMTRYYVKTIRISAKDSPNVRAGMVQSERGKAVTDEELVPGVIGYREYIHRLQRYNAKDRAIKLDGEFYEGEEIMLFPSGWLDLSEVRAKEIGNRPRQAKSLGVDSAMGGDNTCWVVADDLGALEMISEKTPDTAEIPKKTLLLMLKYHLKPERVVFDAGGGGRPHADRLRKQGYNVRAVGFGELATPELKRRGITSTLEQRQVEQEIRKVYRDRRAEMYHLLRQRLEPADRKSKFAISQDILNRRREDGGASLREQLEAIPYDCDDNGRLYVLPKGRVTTDLEGNERKTLTQRIGCSPDEADALVLAIFGLKETRTRMTAGAIT